MEATAQLSEKSGDQLVHQGDPAVDAKKNKSKKSTYWYLDKFSLNIASFWTICNNR